MNVTGVSLYSNNVKLFQFNFQNTGLDSPYQLKKMLGLDADELIPKFYAFSTTGKKFYDVALKPRFVTILLKLNPRYNLGETPASLRAELYKMISGSRISEIELRFLDGVTETSKIFGFITRFEAPPFAKAAEVSITVRCVDPVIRGLTTIELLDASLNDTNPVLVTDTQSTAPHGFDLKITITGALTEFVIQDTATSPEWKFRIVPSSAFASGDILHISSQFGKKHVYMIRSAVTTHLLDKIDPLSVWPIIFPGVNSFHFSQIATFDWDYLRYDASHWGV